MAAVILLATFLTYGFCQEGPTPDCAISQCTMQTRSFTNKPGHKDTPELIEESETGDLAGNEVLVAISHWQTFHKREQALILSLQTFHSYGMDIDIILLTNVHIAEADGLVSMQIVKPHPQCSPNVKDNFCMPWEALAAMRRTAVEGGLRHNFYIYLESDILIPQATFDFWRVHSARLYERGYLLIPFRQSIVEEKALVTDFFNWCRSDVVAYYDTDDTNEYLDPRDRTFIHQGCSYSASWLMMREQFRDWLDHHRSEYESVVPDAHMMREWAACETVTCFPWKNMLTLHHLRMPVTHQLYSHQGEANYPVATLEEIVSDCAGDRSKCVPLAEGPRKLELYLRLHKGKMLGQRNK